MEVSSRTVSQKFHSLVCIIFCLSILCDVQAFINDTSALRSISSVEEEPLLLTPYIEKGQILLAQEKARVQLPNLDVESYSGFFTVSKRYNSNLFFWYFPAQKNPEDSPVMVWLQGGPGITSLLGLFFENGPIYLGRDGTLKYKSSSLTKFVNVVYIDNPVGTGYSYTENPEGYAHNQDDVRRNLMSAIVQFFRLFPELQKNDFFINGETYAGKFILSTAYTIHTNNHKLKNKINLKGISIGNGWIDPENQMTRSDYLYETGLIDSNGKSLFRRKENDIVKLIKENDFEAATKKLNRLLLDNSNTLFNNLTGFEIRFNILRSKSYGMYKKRFPTEEFLQTDNMRSRIHVGNLEFQSGNDVKLNLLTDITNTTRPYLEVLVEHYRVLLYSGQLDPSNPYTSTLNFLRKLSWSGSNEYKKAPQHFWYVDGDLAGYCKKVKNLTVVLVRNAGHVPCADQPRWTYKLLKYFVAGRDL